MAKFTFEFTATQLFGFHQRGDSRQETITVVARSFKKAVEHLKEQLSFLRGRQYLEYFHVTTKDLKGRLALINDGVDGITNLHDNLKNAKFSLFRGFKNLRLAG